MWRMKAGGLSARRLGILLLLNLSLPQHSAFVPGSPSLVMSGHSAASFTLTQQPSGFSPSFCPHKSTLSLIASTSSKFSRTSLSQHRACKFSRRVLGSQNALQLRMSSEDVPVVPANLDQAVEQAGGALRSALLSGKRSIMMDLLIPNLDPNSRGFAQADFDELVGSLLGKFGAIAPTPIRVFFQDLNAVSAGTAFLKNCSYTAEMMEESLLKVSLLGAGDVEADDGSIVLVAPSNTKESKVTPQVREVLKAARGRPGLVINQGLDTLGPDGMAVGMLPIELEGFERVYYLEPLALQASPVGGPDPDSMPPAPLRLSLMRSFPGKWHIHLFDEDDQKYMLQETIGAKPSRPLLMEICGRIVRNKQSKPRNPDLSFD